MKKTAESVSPMHPDKICDRISDAILDACLEQDPMSRVAIETMGGHGIITITGELTTKAYVDMRAIAKSIVGDKYGVQVNVVQQSPEIANGVDTGGAGDQGIMVGYACNDNEDMIPQELYLARSLCKFIYEKYPYDGKTQITLDDEGKISVVVASFQNVSSLDLHNIVNEWLANDDLDINITGIHCNPAGDWNIGGFEADTGLTGRKLMVDNYGPQIPIGGGCFSGKDATKVDRSGAYMARKLAVYMLKLGKKDTEFINLMNPDLVELGGIVDVTVKLAYAIGVALPVMAIAEVKGINGYKTIDLFDMTFAGKTLTPKGIIESLDLRKPQFLKTAEWGHFGNGFTWDK